MQLAEPEEPGRYLVAYSLKTGEALLAGAVVPFQVLVPLAIHLESYLCSAHTVTHKELGLLAGPPRLTFRDAAGTERPVRVTRWKLTARAVEQATYKFTGGPAGRALSVVEADQHKV